MNEEEETGDYIDDIKVVTNLDAETLQRGQWGGKVEFIFSCLSYAVGLGNVWRFPYLCYRNGGGAFLIPFVIMLFVLGIPILFLETCLGQYTSAGPITVWKASPLFKGIGWAMCLTSFSSGIYYTMLIAWTLFYFMKSIIVGFTGQQLPWTKCEKPWATNRCQSLRILSNKNKCERNHGFFSFNHNNTCFLNTTSTISYFNSTLSSNMTYTIHGINEMGTNFTQNLGPTGMFNYLSKLNSTQNDTELLKSNLGHLDMVTPSNEYFHNFVLSISSGFSEIGVPKWELVLCLFACWAIICLCLIRGVQSAGKAVYFTSLFPYLVLTILLIRGLTLEGSGQGIKYFFIPKWHLLANATVWCDAAVQVFFSISCGWGGIIALGSFNKFGNNALFDAFFVALGDGLTSTFAGVTIFSILGYMSHVMNVDIDKLGSDGAGLAFVVYPDIVTSLPVSPLWAILFFAMMLALGFGTMIAMINTVATAICDTWPHFLRRGHRPLILLCSLSMLSFLLGLPCTTSGGIFVLQFMDNYCATYSVLIIGLAELLVMGWVYGADKFRDNIDEMMKKKTSYIWTVFWKFISPAFILMIFIFNLTALKRSKYKDYVYPLWSDIMGGFLSFTFVLPIPVMAIYEVYRSRQRLDLWGKIKQLCKPDSDWGPQFGNKVTFAAVTPGTAIFESQLPLTANYVTSTSTFGGDVDSTIALKNVRNRRV